MHADLKGALEQINTAYRAFEHRGQRMTKEQVKAVCEYGISKGYKTTEEFSDEEVDNIIGLVRIKGCDNASEFEKFCKESELYEVAKQIYAEHPGGEGYYNFTKFLWVSYPDGRPKVRLDDLVPYDEKE